MSSDNMSRPDSDNEKSAHPGQHKVTDMDDNGKVSWEDDKPKDENGNLLDDETMMDFASGSGGGSGGDGGA